MNVEVEIHGGGEAKVCVNDAEYFVSYTNQIYTEQASMRPCAFCKIRLADVFTTGVVPEVFRVVREDVYPDREIKLNSSRARQVIRTLAAAIAEEFPFHCDNPDCVAKADAAFEIWLEDDLGDDNW